MYGTNRLERAVSPECNAIVASKKKFKEQVQKPRETTPAETAIM